MADELTRRIEAILPRVREMRHELHAHPQLRYEETFANELIRRELTSLGVEHVSGLAETGVVGWIGPAGANVAGRKALALRADMDALPMDEQTDAPYRSRNPGCMHACGHDGNTAMLLGAAALLWDLRDRLGRPVKLLFQPAEEGGAGAAAMIRAGALSAEVGGCEVGAVIGQHASPIYEVGSIGVRPGPFDARVDRLEVRVTGRGGHGARPHETRDPIVAAAHVVTALQTVVSRTVKPIDPAVVTIGSVRAGSAANVIPDRAEMLGTIRTYDDAVAEQVMRRVREVCERTAAAHDCAAEVRFGEGYPVAVNAPQAAAYVRETAEDLLGPERVHETEPSMGAEDFAFYARRVPSCMIQLGVRPAGVEDVPGLHHPRFDFNDDALPTGLAVHVRLALSSGSLQID